MKIKNKLLIQDKDWKSECWSLASYQYNLGEILIFKLSPIFLPLYLIFYYIPRNKINGYCFRYLNDYPSFLKSLIRFTSELSALIILKTFNKKILWICHNIDKESHEFHPLLTKYRRMLLKKFADQIFVTDPLLIAPAIRALSIKPIDICTFGAPYSNDFIGDELLPSEITKKIHNIKKKITKRARFGLWIGSGNHKNIPTLYFISQLASLSCQNYPFYFILIGPMYDTLKREHPILLSELQKNCFIITHFKRVDLNLLEWSKNFDFIVKSLSDTSIAYTIYNSSYSNIPVLTSKNNFLSKVIAEYNIGMAINTSQIELIEFYNNLTSCSWDFEKFLNQHTWKSGSENLLNALDS